MLHFLRGCPVRSLRSLLYATCLATLAVIILLSFRVDIPRYIEAGLNVLPTLTQPASSSNSSNPLGYEIFDPFKIYVIQAENITAKLIPYGARLTSLLVPDRNGQIQDVVTGYDDPRQYLHDTETVHTYFGAVVGRYANRIKNSTFTLDGKEYRVPANENNGADALHGGEVGYDQRTWAVTAQSHSSITFTLIDTAEQGFPGEVITHAKFSVDSRRLSEGYGSQPQLTTELISRATTQPTPIMLSNHIYWNLNAFKESDVLNDVFLQLPLSRRYIGTDAILVPNGTIFDVATTYNGNLDFQAGKLVGADINGTSGLCGPGCIGYDTCFIIDREPNDIVRNSLVPVVHMSSSATGISLDIATNQQAIQLYTCNGQDSRIAVKASQIERNYGQGAQHVNKYACVVIETEGWIDGINQPEWNQLGDQIFSPDSGPAVNKAVYQFGTIQ